jgi:AcrR family transcriptional regulator
MVTHQTTHRLRADARRETIISAAIRLFSEKGFRGTTTRELSAAVGVSEPVLYEHFSTKHELYDAVLDRISDAALADLNVLMQQHTEQADSKAFLRGAAKALVEWFAKEPEYTRLLLFSALDRDSVSRVFHSRLRARLVEVLSGFLGQQSSNRCGFDPEIVAHTFICMMAHHGLLQVLFDHRPPHGNEEVMDQMVEIFIRGISNELPYS